MTTYPTHAPVEIRQGLVYKWTLAASAYGDDLLPATYTVTYYFRKDSSNGNTIIATDNGDGTHLVTITDTAFNGLDTGEYYYYAKASDGGSNVYEVDSGHLTVLPEISAAVDPRTQVKTELDLLNTAIETHLTNRGTAIAYSISGRSMSFESLGQALIYREKLEAEYEREIIKARLKKGLRDPRHIGMRFTRV